MATLKNTSISDTGFLQLPVGTTGQRPTPAAGQMRFNSTTGKAEFYNATQAAWKPTINQGIIATGGTVYDVDVEGTTYRVHVFTNTGNSTFTVTQGGSVEYLIVAGGGGGSGNFYDDGAGGGAGGLVTGTTTVTAQAYTVTVGGGGARSSGGAGSTGGNSVAFGLTALGGGGGAGHRGVGQPGGSGGGGAGYYGNDGLNYAGGAATQPGSASGGFGNAGGGYVTGEIGGTFLYPNSSGGGGAGSVGGRPITSAAGGGGQGGIGLSLNITGNSVFYAGGGGGLSLGLGGLGGGARATTGRGGSPALDATPNTGGGGGGGRASSGETGIPSNGGSGIVIIRYPLRQENPEVAAGKVVGDGLVLDLDFAKPTVYAGSGTVVNDSRLNGISFNRAGSPDFRNARTHRSGFDIAGNEANYLESVGTVRFENQWTYELLLRNNGTVSPIPLMTGRNGSDQRSKINLHLGWTTSGSGVANARHIFLGSDWGTWQGFDTPQSFSAYTEILLQVTMNNGVANVWWTTPQSGRIQPINNVDYGTGGNITRDLPILIGKYASAGYVLNGIVHLFRFYNRALTTDELNKNYEALKWRFGV